MNVHISYRIAKPVDVEKEINHSIEKLSKRLQVFRPDLVHLRGSIEQNSPREGFGVSLNLRLPSGQITAQQSAANVSSALKSAFDQLTQQLRKHKDLLRNTHKWSRRGASGRSSAEPQVPPAQAAAAVQPPTVSADDVHSFVNANLPRLQRFVERELRYRELSGTLTPNLLSPEEVIDEAIARALDETVEKPDRLALEAWLYRLALRSMDELFSRQQEEVPTVTLNGPVAVPGISGNDEAELQYHQPDESLTAENLIADRRTPNPEEAAYSDEMIGILQLTLDGAGRAEREAFILHAIEGFSVDEIASITDRSADQVRGLIARARDHVRKSSPLANRFRDRLLQASK